MKTSGLLPSHPHGARLAQLFSYGWNWIEAPNEGLRPNWKTNDRYPIKPRTLWSRFQDAATIIGVRFGSSTAYGMIDIDVDSPYNSPEKVRDIKWALETIGITRTITIRSSFSNGLHIYCPLPQNFPTWGVACALEQCLQCHGFDIVPGQLELFPNTKSFGKFWDKDFTDYNAHRLPLQPATGALMVDEDLDPIPNGDSLAVFFARWDNAAAFNDAGEVGEAISTARANRRRRRRRATGKVESWKSDLEQIIAEGWTDHGQTNHLLKEIACYGRVFLGLEGEALVSHIETTAINCPGFFEWSDHQHEIHRRSKHWAAAAQAFYWPLGTIPIRDKTTYSYNEYRAANARERIAQAMQEIGDIVGLGIRALAAKIVDLAGCSLATLYRHRDLWHPGDNSAPPPAAGAAAAEQSVTPQPEPNTGNIAAMLALLREGLYGTQNQGVTHQPPQNEVCNLKSPPQKNLTSGGKEGGVGGRKGYPQAKTTPQPVENSGSGWLPRLDWKQGAVKDV